MSKGGTVRTVDRTHVAAVAGCLRDGGIVLVPTDTVFGLAVLPADEAAVNRLFQLKGRSPERRLPVMVAETGQLASLGVAVTDAARTLLASQYVPGPLTIALGFADHGRPDWLRTRDEVAVRIPRDDFLLAVLRQTGPLFVTSANAHGMASPDRVEEILDQLSDAPDMIVEGAAGGGQPSTLVNCRLVPPVVEREGAVSKAEIARLLS